MGKGGNNQIQPRKGLTTTQAVLLSGILILTIGLGGMGMVIALNRDVQRIIGTVKDTSTHKAFVSRKTTYDRQFLKIEYTINEKHYLRTAAAPGQQTYQQGWPIPVFYYPPLPQFAWFFHHGNPILAYFVLIAIAGAAVVAAALMQIRAVAKKAAMAARQKQQKRKG